MTAGSSVLSFQGFKVYVYKSRHYTEIIIDYHLVNGPGIESWWGRDFPHLSKPALGLTQPFVQCVPSLSRG